ncbi:hypothetical protein D3C86_1309610 [compost metagenome]
MVGVAGCVEEGVRETVEIGHDQGVELFIARDGDGEPFGPAHDRPRQVKARAGGASPGKHEARQRRDLLVEGVDQALKEVDLLLIGFPAGTTPRRSGELRADVEEHALDFQKALSKVFELSGHMGQGQSHSRVGLVHGAIGLDP